jgi:EAL domain-containing protein (putative c-di-GMP-specific phosphodiesterase class I)
VVSVNLSGRQIMHPDIVGTVQDALTRSGLPPHALCLEITESVLLDDVELSTSVLASLKSLGVQIGLDDFGTGYSSLTYLRRFPVDVLKIDRSFVEGVGDSHEDRAIVAAVTDLARALGMTTVGEGVETDAQARELQALGCDAAQGFLWSKAVPDVDALAWVRSAGGGSSLRHTA